ncbi:MAG: response regulator transcription factor [Planctomycetota bacterium]|nr:response regulator transcription factor [Planctomycetota bacterium]
MMNTANEENENTAAAAAIPETVEVKRILVVEDERTLAMGIRDALVHANFEADVAHDGDSGLEKCAQTDYDLIVLDLMLPGRNGLELLKALREKNHRVRVLILTALAEESHVLQCFEAGADDYMTKPFSPRELVARINAQFRRGPGYSPDNTPIPKLDLPHGISVDLARLEIHRDGNTLLLTPREGDILEYLIKHHDKVVTREDLLRDVWSYRNPNVATRTVDIHIVGLRRKIEPDPADPTLIQTVRGKGYRWYA